MVREGREASCMVERVVVGMREISLFGVGEASVRG